MQALAGVAFARPARDRASSSSASASRLRLRVSAGTLAGAVSRAGSVSKTRRHFATAAFIAFVALALFWLASPVFSHIRARPPEAELSRLQATGAALVAELEEHRRATGRYPPDLARSGITVPDDAYGGWTYRRDPGGFVLSIGHYEHDGFNLAWSSRTNRWTSDL